MLAVCLFVSIMQGVSNRLNHLTASRLIEERGLTITEVADNLEINRPHLSRMLLGQRRFPAERIPDLAQLLRVHPYELLGPTDPKAAVIELADRLGVTPEDLGEVVA